VSRAIAASRDREAGDRERARTWRGDVTIATREKRAGDPAVSQETAVPFSRFSAREKSERIHVTEELTALNARRIRVDFVSKLCTHVCVCVYRYILYIYIYIYIMCIKHGRFLHNMAFNLRRIRRLATQTTAIGFHLMNQTGAFGSIFALWARLKLDVPSRPPPPALSCRSLSSASVPPILAHFISASCETYASLTRARYRKLQRSARFVRRIGAKRTSDAREKPGNRPVSDPRSLLERTVSGESAEKTPD